MYLTVPDIKNIGRVEEKQSWKCMEQKLVCGRFFQSSDTKTYKHIMWFSLIPGRNGNFSIRDKHSNAVLTITNVP